MNCRLFVEVLQRNHLLPRDQGWPGRIGWHSYSTMLRALKVDVKVQQELLRHADIRTTLNIYTKAVPEALRSANSRLRCVGKRGVGMLLPAPACMSLEAHSLHENEV